MMLKIYSNQVESVKTFALNCCYFICDRHRNQTIPSAFKRNDALSRALGYKSHSELVSMCNGNTPPKSSSEVDIYTAIRSRSHLIAQEFVAIFDGLSSEQIYLAITGPAPKQTEFEIIDGTPIVQFSPLNSDVSNEQRESSEIDEWWNVPFIMEHWDVTKGETSSYTVYCLNGGAWDRATAKAYVDTLSNALAAARQLKDDNPLYRDYAKPLVRISVIAIARFGLFRSPDPAVFLSSYFYSK
ncbi:hypothetical protein [Vibrio coralliilyticus]|uniref:hypothetical protein n=1 Tax=Vibrio coralliilyticus TaxID=190893 RepID=UPI00148E3503|nr:hypothetical protein [Vibrio coralliilyticus]NOI32280.1 hypothetical protein [Vibrio coralliilyticus]